MIAPRPLDRKSSAAEITRPGSLPIRRHFVALTFLRWFPTGLTIPAMVLLLTSRGVSLQTVGLVLLCYSLTCALLELPTGSLSDVIGRRVVLTISGLVFAGSAVMIAFVQTPLLLAVGLMIGGLARALDSGPLEAWYVDRARADDPSCDLKPGLSRAAASGEVALGVGSLVGGGLIAIAPFPDHGQALLLTWSVPYLVSGLLALVSTMFVLRWVHDTAQACQALPAKEMALALPRTVLAGARLITRSPVLRRLAARSLVHGMALLTLELLSPLKFRDSIGAAGYATLVTLAFGGAAVGSRLGPQLARLSRSVGRGVVFATLLAGACLAGLALPGWWAPALAYLLVYTAFGLTTPLVGELLHEETGSSERATVLSVQSLLLQGGGGAANLAIPALVAVTSFHVTWLAVGGLLLLSVSFLLGLPRGRTPVPSSVPLQSVASGE